MSQVKANQSQNVVQKFAIVLHYCLDTDDNMKYCSCCSYANDEVPWLVSL